MIYETAKLAKTWKLLPASWKPEHIEFRMWHSHARPPTPRLSIDEEIKAAAASPDVVHTGFGMVAPDEETLAAEALVHREKNGGSELGLLPKSRGQARLCLSAKPITVETRRG